MKRTSKSFGFAVIAAIGFAALCLTACPQPTGKPKSKNTTDTTPPTVVSVTPNGPGAPVGGNVVITFSEPMDTTPGTVLLETSPLVDGSWSEGNTVYTVAYSLSPGTDVTVTISGFKDKAGNAMTNPYTCAFGTALDIAPNAKAGLYDHEVISADDTPLVEFDKTSPTTATNTFNAAIAKAKQEGSPPSYTLVLDGDVSAGNIDLGSVTIRIVGLGGKRTISLSADGSPLFTVNTNAQLSLYNNITLRGLAGNTGALVKVNGGTLYMRSGSAITGNTNSTDNGGGVYMQSGYFIMSGGEISGNTANGSGSGNSSGGGVCMAGGTFTLNGGEIKGNTVNSTGSDSSSFGGGVYVAGGTFTMNGGIISGNTLNSDSKNRSGGGVYVAGATFAMNGGEISGHTSSEYGGGVCVQYQGVVDWGEFTMTGGVISDNTSKWWGGGLYVGGNSAHHINFALSGGEIKNNTAVDQGGGMRLSYADFEMTGGTVSGNKVTAEDDDYDRSGGGVSMAETTFTMSGGAISGNTVNSTGSKRSTGGGVAMQGNGTFAMKGGEISGNTVTGSKAWGGGVYKSADTTGSFTLSGTAAIKNNSANGTAESMGGGAYVANVANRGTFDMKGGEISGNTAKNGGGVYLGSPGTFRMADGTVYGSNAASAKKNTASATNGGAALFAATGSTAQRGTFSGDNTWNRLGDLATNEKTIKVEGGVLQP